MLSRTAPIFLALCLSASGCATGFSAGELSPADIPVLERAVAVDATDAAAWTRLGVAYGAADRAADALEALERAVALEGAPTAAWAHLGTRRDEAGDLEGAALAYRQYLEEGGGSAAGAVRSRLAAVDHALLAQRAREALEMESAMTDEPPNPATVGVLPLTVEGPAEYQALGVGLAELLTTDLSLTDRLNVVERAQLNALVEEMKLSLGGFTDEASAARAGRLIRAGRLVQGQVAIAQDAGEARLTALIVNAVDALTAGQAEQGGALDMLMDMEVQLALQIYRELGIELTASERARLEEKPTGNLQAFLAYSEGLQLLDQGSYEAAAGRFDAATSLDPGFSAARQAALRAQGVAQTTTQTVSNAASVDLAPAPASDVGATGTTAIAMDQLANATVPAGVTTTNTGGGSGSAGGETATVETTETTAGTGVGQVVTIPIVLVRPRPSIIFWRIP